MDATDQRALDQRMIELDGTDNKGTAGRQCAAGRFAGRGAGCSRAMRSSRCSGTWRRWADAGRKPVMPVPMMNIINGGAHADNSLDVQEFMVLPVGAPTLSEALRYGAEIFHTLKKILHDRGLTTAVGDEGGFAPNLPSNEAALETIIEAIDKRRLQASARTSTSGLDVASSEFFRDGQLPPGRRGTQLRCRRIRRTTWRAWCRAIPIITIEDGMSEGDWEGWALLTKALGSKVQLVGDDLFVTNTKILAQGIERGIANAILIKVNQIGTLSETLAAIEMAERRRLRLHRVASFRRDRGLQHRRHRRGDRRDADQDRFHVALGSRRQVQPAAADRGSAGIGGAVCGARGIHIHALGI